MLSDGAGLGEGCRGRSKGSGAAWLERDAEETKTNVTLKLHAEGYRQQAGGSAGDLVEQELHGFGHHPSLRRIDLSSTAVESIEELKHLAREYLAVVVVKAADGGDVMRLTMMI
eukprot:753776-Hanusia_phi.AAC.1